MEVEKKRYLHYMWSEMPVQGKVASVIVWLVFSFFISYTILTPYYEEQKKFYTYSYEEICKIFEEVTWKREKSGFEDISGEVTLYDIGFSIEGDYIYSLSYTNIMKGKSYSIPIEVTVGEDGELKHSMPNISSKEKCEFQAERFKIAYALCFGTPISGAIFCIVMLISSTHKLIDERIEK